MRIPAIILSQLGGSRFVAMTGAHAFIADGDALVFSIGRNKSRANRVRIELTPMDTYTVTFWRHTDGSVHINKNGTIKRREMRDDTISVHDDIYCDELESLFTDVTGIYTRF